MEVHDIVHFYNRKGDGPFEAVVKRMLKTDREKYTNRPGRPDSPVRADLRVKGYRGHVECDAIGAEVVDDPDNLPRDRAPDHYCCEIRGRV